MASDHENIQLISTADLLHNAEEQANTNAPCGYHPVDKDVVPVRINDTELNWFGYNQDELIGNLKPTIILLGSSSVSLHSATH
jgi:hypothetical protein